MRQWRINSYTLHMREFWANQFSNRFLWVPFLVAFGAALYFCLPFEVNLPYCAIITAILFIAAFIRKIPTVLRAIIIFCFGFCYALSFANFVNTPQISRNLHTAILTANVINIDYTNDKARLYLKVKANEIGSASGDAIIRVSTDTDTLPNVNDTISANVELFSPSLPEAPNSFDYSRWMYFNNLSATGYMKNFKVIHPASKSNINSLRNYLHKKANSFLSDVLVLGYKNSINKDEKTIWTNTGVGHIWSISGLHMTLVSTFLFILFYLVFRSIPAITRRVPARIPALICAWIGLLFYLFLSGIGIATIRAFLMATLVFAAFIFGRRAISMRNVCIAFCIIFLINPHYVMQPGFQLSFAAIFGLVWLWNEKNLKMPKNKILKIIAVAVLTSIIAIIFTAPFIVAHFQRFPLYSLLGNLILLPIFSVAIMPLVMIGTFTAAVGFTFPLVLAEKIYGFGFSLAKSISSLPLATLSFPSVPNLALFLIIVGFLCLILVRPIKNRVNYILFSSFVFLGIVITVFNPKPIFYVTNDHALAGFVNSENKLEFSNARASNHYFAFDTWKQLNGEKSGTKNVRYKHNKGVYIYNAKNFNLAYVQKFTALENNISDLCNDKNMNYIVSYFDVDSPKCNGKILRGGFVIYKSGRIKYTRLNRRWHNPL